MYKIIFDRVIVEQLRELARNRHLKQRINKLFDRLELKGPDAGKLIDFKLHIYDLKTKKPAIRIYYTYTSEKDEINVFEFHLKKGRGNQHRIISKIKNKIIKILNHLLYISHHFLRCSEIRANVCTKKFFSESLLPVLI